jgi:hypothetical protein
MTLGGFGALTLDEARSLAEKRTVEIDEGRDPVPSVLGSGIMPLPFHDLEQI